MARNGKRNGRMMILAAAIVYFGCGPDPTDPGKDGGNGGGCLKQEDCTGGKVCIQGACKEPTCSDGLKDGEEVGVDCGSVCGKDCDTGKRCMVSTDCMSRVCSNGKCQEPTCSDGVQNGAETGVDCGGVCAACVQACVPSEADPECAGAKSCACVMTDEMKVQCEQMPDLCPANFNSCTPGCNSCGYDLPKSGEYACAKPFKYMEQITKFMWAFRGGSSRPGGVTIQNGMSVTSMGLDAGLAEPYLTLSGDSAWQECKNLPFRYDLLPQRKACFRLRFYTNPDYPNYNPPRIKADVEEFNHDPALDPKPDKVLDTGLQGTLL